MMHYKIRHITEYRYREEVSLCYNVARIIPRTTERQHCLNNRIYLNPYPSSGTEIKDYFGNVAYHFDIQKPHRHLIISSESDITLQQNRTAMNDSLRFDEAIDVLNNSTSDECLDAREFLLDSMMIRKTEAFRAYAAPCFPKEEPLNKSIMNFTEKIYSEFIYDPEFTTIATPLEEVLEHKRGVCQDFAHLQITCLRALGIPAKYVSGYIETLPPPGQTKLRGADATHAWVAYYCPGAGWVEVDPTNNTIVRDQHIVTAFGRDFYDVTPIKGVIYGGGKDPKLHVSVDVSRVIK